MKEVLYKGLASFLFCYRLCPPSSDRVLFYKLNPHRGHRCTGIPCELDFGQGFFRTECSCRAGIGDGKGGEEEHVKDNLGNLTEEE